MRSYAQVHYLSRQTFDPDNSTVAAKAIIEAEMSRRMDLVHQLAVRLSALEATITAVDTARHAALAAGWSEEQLLELGLGAVENSTRSAGRRVARDEPEPEPEAEAEAEHDESISFQLVEELVG
ncbi:hypothetical protein [Lacisediminihabitans profunda]|uniref:Uncharacterized protein n=1 Tax=Lacisediminihabitans profunda TaxID=2594790 RepID=A0A5C8UK12_9MICO|nr:hypothetical protein [Lacisediminihabitans profunda]TXN28125.1 hypothetical protein FVP33_18455 [Lacisediminihabitans profunda]